ncbi:MAG TPA: hypothetical protein VHW04_01060 [Solirubrobacteraceae bacterium]|nr:hypothetical protein [Solirubrobacteraceae bacterium]
MVSRLGARLLTGPAAFLIGGLLEVGALALVTWRDRLRRRRRGPGD